MPPHIKAQGCKVHPHIKAQGCKVHQDSQDAKCMSPKASALGIAKLDFFIAVSFGGHALLGQ